LRGVREKGALSRQPPGRGRFRRFGILLAALLLALALLWGRTRGAPELEPLVREIFPESSAIQVQRGIHHAYDPSGALLGWAATGEARGYGGPLSLLVGIDTLGSVAGIRVVEQRETPTFWRMARAQEYFRGIAGRRYDELEYDYRSVVSITGATLSTDAIVEGIRVAVARVAGEAFDVRVPLQSKPFEFGFLEITVLALFAVGVAGHRLRGPARRRLRWAAQITGLVVLGFWKDSPITLSKIAAFLSGFFPDPRTSLALYLLLAGFLLTSVFYGRNLYCLYACPFGAAQRVVGAIGGFRLKVPPGAARVLMAIRNAVVFAALFVAFLTLQPVLSGYEPFAALFSLHGTTLQWFLLFLVLVASLFLTEPWCTFLCPMRAMEKVLQEGKGWVRWGRARGGQGEAGVPAPPAAEGTDGGGMWTEGAGTPKAGAATRAGGAARRLEGAVRRSGASGTRAGWPTYVAIFLGLVVFGVILGVMAQNLTQGS
jgi:NosR/NirI family transcriptional regulator, nitrous oxide reductase regulator